MAVPTLETIHPKFYPAIINRNDFEDRELQEKVKAAFGQAGDVRLDGYVVSGARKGKYPDAHLYGVRKAEKIQGLISKYGFDDCLQVPKKYLYFHEGKWYVFTQKLESSDPLQLNPKCVPAKEDLDEPSSKYLIAGLSEDASAHECSAG